MSSKCEGHALLNLDKSCKIYVMAREMARVVVIKDGCLLAMKRNKFGNEYYTLVGGGIDMGETAQQAAIREVKEETGMDVKNLRHIFTENAGRVYGIQHIFLADWVSGEPALDPDCEEARISALGKNTYEPVWLPISQLTKVKFLSGSVQQAISAGLKVGWPAKVKHLDWLPATSKV